MKYIIIITSVFFSIISFNYSYERYYIPYLEEKRDKAEKEIIKMTRELSCDYNRECKSFGFGNNPCGGFDRYKIYSTKNLNEEILLKKVDEFYTLDKKYNTAKVLFGTCAVIQPIHSACIRGRCTDMGDEPNYVSPLHYAVVRNDAALIEELLSTGHDINGLSNQNETPLLYAVKFDRVTAETIELVIEEGADVNFRYGEEGDTALIQAVIFRNLTAIEALLKQGADPYLPNHHGNALDYARESRSNRIFELFKEMGFPLEAQ